MSVGTDRSSLHLRLMDLCRQGVTLQGAQQLLSGEVVTGLADRQRLLQLAIHAEKNQDTMTVENDETHTVGHDKSITISGGRTESLCRLGLSANGAREFLSGQPVTSAADRQALAANVNKTPTPGGPVPIPYPNIAG